MKTLEARIESIETKIDDLTDTVTTLVELTKEGFAKTQEEIEDLARMSADQFSKTATREDLEQFQAEILESMGTLKIKSGLKTVID